MDPTSPPLHARNRTACAKTAARAAARRYAASRKERVNIAYVCISGHNVSVEDARALGELIGDTPVRLDLIDVFDTNDRYHPPSAEELGVFRDALRRYLPQPVARRYSGGKDIRAACGTMSGESPAPLQTSAP